jgi:hypothetical protein
MQLVDNSATVCQGNAKIVIVITLLLFIINFNCCVAGSWYIAQNATGNGSGADAYDCLPLNWFNASADWNNGTGTIMPGDTVWLEGTFTNSATFYGKGTESNPIMIRFDLNAKFVAPYWSVGAINAGGTPNWIIIDGGTNGIIESSANGSGLAYQMQSYGIDVAYMSNLEIRNLTVLNQYVNQSGDSNEFGYAFYVGMAGNTNISIHNCGITNAFLGMDVYYVAAGNAYVNIYSNNEWGCSVAVNIGQGQGGSTLDYVNVWANMLDGCNVWDGSWPIPGGMDHHHQDPIHIFANVGNSEITHLKIFRNILGSHFGTNATALCNPEGVISADVYDNVFLSSNTYPDVAFLDFKCASPPITNAWRAMNNSFIGVNGAGIAIYATGGTNIYIANNAVYLPNMFVYLDSLSSLNYCDYNLCFQPSADWARCTNGAMVNVAQWESAYGFDFHSLTNNPSWNKVAFPASSSPLIGVGTNLSNVFDCDVAGALRPAFGAWDIGAYQHITNTLPFPTNLRVLRQ